MSDSRIDEAILCIVGERWMKVAAVVMEVAKAMSGGVPAEGEGYEVIGQHIEALVRDGRLAARGDVKRWRFSEIRRFDDNSN